MELEDLGTAKAGSDPATGQNPDSPSGTGAKTTTPDVELDDNGKPLPFNENPKWKSARQAEKKLNAVLEANELDSIEDLVELVQSGKKMAGKGLDEDALEDLISKARKMEEVEEYWATQRELQKRAEEGPDETAARLERENQELKRRLSGKDEVDSSKRALETFEKKSRTFLENSIKDLDKEERDALEFFMGVGHPFGEIDITNEAQVSKMGKQVIKKIQDIEQRAIKKYVAGKKELLHVGSTSTPAAPANDGIRNMKQARNAMADQLRHWINQ